ncbi:MAG: hypothetical protein C0410_03950 [Anaerolinea sp.]|nr:hypothetical protein [Anaerolinea sp.]
MIRYLSQIAISFSLILSLIPGQSTYSMKSVNQINDLGCSSNPIPGGGTITFTSNRNGNNQIYVMDGDECHLQQLTDGSTENFNGLWSKNGEKHAFFSENIIYTMNADGSGKSQLVPSSANHTSQAFPSWSPDGSKIAFQGAGGNYEVFVINTDGTNLQQLTNTPGWDNGDPSWSPDGSQIAYFSRGDPAFNYGEIWVMNADGSNKHPVMVDYSMSVGYVTWSPDGSKMAFMAHEWPERIWKIYVMNSDGSDIKLLTNSSGHSQYPQFSPDSNYLLYMSNRVGNYEIYVLDLNSGNETRITNNPSFDYFPVWGGPGIQPPSVPPSTTISLNPANPDGLNSWYVSNVHTSVTASSNITNVTETRCILDPATIPLTFDDIPEGCAFIGEGADISMSGQHFIYAASKDNFGNKEIPVSDSFKIDNNLPSISANLIPTEPAITGWYNASIGAPTVDFACTDSESGIALGACPGSYTFSEGINQNYSAYVNDQAGNVSHLTEVKNVNVDVTPPTLNPVVSINPIILNGSATVTSGAVDLLSGIASESCGTLDTQSVGTKTVTCIAKDNAGNTSSKSIDYIVIYKFEGFLQPINDTAHQTCSGCPVSIFKGKSTVPVKFQLKDANGVVIQTNSLPLWITPQQGSVITGNIDESIYSYPATLGNTYTFNGDHYAFNWKTTNYLNGYFWRIGVLLDDGQTYYVNIGLK